MKNKVTYTEYKKALDYWWKHQWLPTSTKSKYEKAKETLGLYKKQNRFKPLTKFLNTEFNPHIKYGKFCRFLFRSIMYGLILVLISQLMLFVSKSFFAYVIISSLPITITSLMFYIRYEYKYQVEKIKYEEAKTNPNWEREQKLKKILK